MIVRAVLHHGKLLSATEGQRLLRERLTTRSQAEVARLVGCGRSTVCMYANGQKVPQLWRERRAFELKLGIPGDSWDWPPNVTIVNSQAATTQESAPEAAQ